MKPRGLYLALVWDAMRSDGVKGHQMIVEVRNSDGPVMEAKLSFEIDRNRKL